MAKQARGLEELSLIEELGSMLLAVESPITDSESSDGEKFVCCSHHGCGHVIATPCLFSMLH